MTPHEFNLIGKRLFGDRWKTPLAKKLGYQRETISIWSKGKRPIPPVVPLALQGLLAEQLSSPIPYKEKRHNAIGNSILLGNAAVLIHGDATKIYLVDYFKGLSC